MANYNDYRHITNFEIKDLEDIYIAVTAVGITDYVITKRARDLLGRILPDHYALYFKKTVSEKDGELFSNAFLMVRREKRKSKENSNTGE